MRLVVLVGVGAGEGNIDRRRWMRARKTFGIVLPTLGPQEKANLVQLERVLSRRGMVGQGVLLERRMMIGISGEEWAETTL